MSGQLGIGIPVHGLDGELDRWTRSREDIHGTRVEQRLVLDSSELHGATHVLLRVVILVLCFMYFLFMQI
jgi:hypothetical protein